jgi:Uma2 family endonuclease
MKMVILDPNTQKKLIRERRSTGGDRFDEVWEGVYVMSPSADNLHQYLAGKLVSIIDQALEASETTKLFPGVNISDREVDWKTNYRCPDVAVFLATNPAQDRGTHWLGGPDFAIEIISPHDRTRRKLPFYAKVGVRELLILDRNPWSLELYRRSEGTLRSVGKSNLEQPAALSSEVLPLTFRILQADPQPRIEISLHDGSRNWLV